MCCTHSVSGTQQLVPVSVCVFIYRISLYSALVSFGSHCSVVIRGMRPESPEKQLLNEQKLTYFAL